MFDPELIQSSKTTSISNKIEKPKIDYCVLNYFSNIYTCNSNFKTRPNLSTYSRKAGNFNGTIIFEIIIKKKSSTIN